MISVLYTRVRRLPADSDIAIGTESFNDWQTEVSVPALWNELWRGTLSLALPIGLDLSLTKRFLDYDSYDWIWREFYPAFDWVPPNDTVLWTWGCLDMLFSIEDSSSLLDVQPILLMLFIWTGTGLLYSDDCYVISSDL